MVVVADADAVDKDAVGGDEADPAIAAVADEQPARPLPETAVDMVLDRLVGVGAANRLDRGADPQAVRRLPTGTAGRDLDDGVLERVERDRGRVIPGA